MDARARSADRVADAPTGFGDLISEAENGIRGMAGTAMPRMCRSVVQPAGGQPRLILHLVGQPHLDGFGW